MKKYIAVMSLLGASLFLPNALLAHAALSGAVPGDGAVVNESPETVDLSFNEEVRLLKVSISSAESGEIDTGFVPSSEAASRFAVALPTLGKGAYTVNWTIMGDDSHRVEGDFAFTVDPAAAEVGAQSPETVSGESHAAHSGH